MPLEETINMQYILIGYTPVFPVTQAYQESVITASKDDIIAGYQAGDVLRYTDIQGNTIGLPETAEITVVNPKTPLPAWGDPKRYYVLLQYTYRATPIRLYAEVNRYTDLDGKDLDFRTATEKSVEIHVENFFPDTPPWGN